MITIYNPASIARVRDSHLRSIVERRVDELGELSSWTEIFVVGPGDGEADIIREVGFSPLVEPIEGVRFGREGFQPFWDYLTDRGDWFELSVSFGSSFAYILFIADADGVLPDLRSLCRAYADR